MGDIAKPKPPALVGLLHGHKPSVEDTTRLIHIGDAPGSDSNPRQYLNNRTSTTKYSPLTFLPKALFEQYRRVANIYFTLVAGLSLTPYSPVRPWTTFLPLVLVLGVSMGKEAVEDWKRYRADQEVNNRAVKVLDRASKKFVVKRWQDVQVGDIVIVERDEYFPADLLLVTAENEEGICYIETMNLDGETNLKIKKALDQTKVLRENNISDMVGYVECEPPNDRLYTFTGNLELSPPFVQQQVKLSLAPGCILLRGASLRNTPRIFGLVVYAGHDTKVFMNATQAPSKRSKIERTVDYIIVCTFSLLLSMCITGCIYFAIWTRDKSILHWYLSPDNTSGFNEYDPKKPALVAVTNFITAFILYGYLIPISLYVSIEMVKVAQAMVFINQDRNMYHEASDTCALARTSNLNEELGMVNTILSDKTGTLTRNVMEFFKCSIAGVSYGAGITEVDIANAERRGETLTASKDPNLERYKERFFNFYDSRLMDGAWTTQTRADVIEQFFRLLAVCHSVIPDGPADEKVIKYEAESPDEAALVVAAKVLGFFFYKRTNTTVCVRERTASGTRDVEYEILNLLEFNSTRKRMSVIFRDPQQRIVLLTKGADSVIYDLLDNSNPLNKEFKAVTKDHMEEYASAGLRTLCLAYAVLDPTMYERWQHDYFAAKTALTDREARLMAVAEAIEKNLILLGATAIEDKLQEGVPRCIKRLAIAGIRIWVLTGDKMETAINIGYACSLLTDEMLQTHISAAVKEVEELEEAGRKAEADEAATRIVSAQLNTAQANIAKSPLNALVIDGKALTYALKVPELRDRFLAVGTACKAVICCRVSPLQKALVTALVKSKGDTTLAIGDGANDVGMIQKAHIGVGISGQEGMQAVQNSDFAIAQFAYLEHLLLVHGRWNYRRISRMVCFFFYKNVMFGTSIFIFNAYSQFSGQIIYDDFYMSLFNVIFTSLTPIVIGILDRDVTREQALKYPQLYQDGQRNRCFSVKTIGWWFFTGLYQCGFLTAIVFNATRPLAANRGSGHPWTHWELGVLLFSFIILTIHLQISTIFEQWTWLHFLSIYLSVAIWWLYLIAYGQFPLNFAQDLFKLFNGVVAGGGQYWLFLIAVPFCAVLPEFFLRQCKRIIWPDDNLLVSEHDKRPGNGSEETGKAGLRAKRPQGSGAGNGHSVVPSPTAGNGVGKLEGYAMSAALPHDDTRRDYSLLKKGQGLRERFTGTPSPGNSAAGAIEMEAPSSSRHSSPSKRPQGAITRGGIHLPPLKTTPSAESSPYTTQCDSLRSHNGISDMPVRLPEFEPETLEMARLGNGSTHVQDIAVRRPMFPSTTSEPGTPSASPHQSRALLDPHLDIRRPVYPTALDSAVPLLGTMGPETVSWNTNTAVLSGDADSSEGRRSADAADADFYVSALQRTPSQMVGVGGGAAGNARRASPMRPGVGSSATGRPVPPSEVYSNGIFGMADEDKAIL